VAFHRATFLLQAGFSDIFWPFARGRAEVGAPPRRASRTHSAQLTTSLLGARRGRAPGEELQAQLDSPLDVRWTPPDALHTFIAGFTEHPSLLAPGDAPRYRPLPDAKLADLGDRRSGAGARLPRRASRGGPHVERRGC
jgi:hypothetical protein